MCFWRQNLCIFLVHEAKFICTECNLYIWIQALFFLLLVFFWCSLLNNVWTSDSVDSTTKQNIIQIYSKLNVFPFCLSPMPSNFLVRSIYHEFLSWGRLPQKKKKCGTIVFNLDGVLFWIIRLTFLFHSFIRRQTPNSYNMRARNSFSILCRINDSISWILAKPDYITSAKIHTNSIEGERAENRKEKNQKNRAFRKRVENESIERIYGSWWDDLNDLNPNTRKQWNVSLWMIINTETKWTDHTRVWYYKWCSMARFVKEKKMTCSNLNLIWNLCINKWFVLCESAFEVKAEFKS